MKRPYSKFIILSTFRSGTHHLASLLDSHPNIIAFGQVFNRSLYRKPAHWSAIRQIAPSLYLNHRIFKTYHDGIRTVGYCLMYDQIEQLQSTHPVLKDIRKHKYGIIHLTRDNLLKTYISMRVASRTGVWKTTQRTMTLNHTLFVDPNECEAFFRQVALYESRYTKFFSSHRVLHITYEQLISDPAVTIDTIQRFLSVEKRPLTSSYRKQATQALRETVFNYEALKKHFAKTQWERYFTE